MLFLDTEFSSFKGQLISMGIVSSITSEEFYAVLPLPSVINPWVQEHVIPFLLIDPIPHFEFRDKLYRYLKRHEAETIIADWPEDLSHLLESLCEPNGVSYNLQLNLKLIKSGDLKSKIPHNALSDARALAEWYLADTDY